MSAPTKITGGCLCKAVRYEVNFPENHDFKANLTPPQSVACFCSLCRKQSGAVVVHVHILPRSSFTWTSPSAAPSAPLANYQVMKDNLRWFCTACGSYLAWEGNGIIEVTAGSVDEECLVGKKDGEGNVIEKGVGEQFCHPEGAVTWVNNSLGPVTEGIKGTRWKFSVAHGEKLPAKAAGGCLCGAIRYSVVFPPGHDFAMNSTKCLCTACRKQSGAMMLHLHTLPLSSFSCVAPASELGDYSRSPGYHRLFCKRCGSFIAWRQDPLLCGDVHGLADIGGSRATRQALDGMIDCTPAHEEGEVEICVGTLDEEFLVGRRGKGGKVIPGTGYGHLLGHPEGRILWAENDIVGVTDRLTGRPPNRVPRVSPSRSRSTKSAKAAASALADIGRAAVAPRAWSAATLQQVRPDRQVGPGTPLSMGMGVRGLAAIVVGRQKGGEGGARGTCVSNGPTGQHSNTLCAAQHMGGKISSMRMPREVGGAKLQL
ncbi:hypothetical protein V502_09505 [Pseudogymnoascus sp. VKM F-4520 (FW-2644)]|nr:hypothetical protein V502_09505 [Pseudogymnoascus sp. VKM F-4520 (FW-2644)]